MDNNNLKENEFNEQTNTSNHDANISDVASSIQNAFVNPPDNKSNSANFNSHSNKNTKNSKNVIVSILIVILIALIGAVGYIVFKELNTPKTMFLKTMNKYFESNDLDNNILNISELFNSGATLKMDSNVNLNGATKKIFSGKINFEFIDNPSEKKQYLNLTFDDDNNSVINLEGYLKDNQVFFTMKNIFDKYYYTDSEYIKMYDENDQKLINNLKNNILNSLNDYFTNDMFIQSKEENIQKISVSISDKDVANLLILILTNLKDDNSLSLFVTEDMTLDNLQNQIDENINSIKESLCQQSDDKKYIYNIYLNGENLVKQEVILDSIKLIIEGETSGNISLLNLLNNDKEIVSGNYDKNKLNLKISDSNNNPYNLTLTYNNNITDNKVAANYNLVIKTIVEYEEVELKINTKLEIFKESSIPQINISNAKNVKDISDEELVDIYTKLSEIPLLAPIFNMYTNSFDNSLESNDFEF